MKFRKTAKLKPSQVSDQRNALNIHRKIVQFHFPEEKAYRTIGHPRGVTYAVELGSNKIKGVVRDRPDGADRVRPFANKQRLRVKVRRPIGPSGTSH